MASDTWVEVAPHLVQACVPIVQAAANHHFDSKMLDKRRSYEVKLAERRAEGLQQMADTARAPDGSGPSTAATAAGAATAGAAAGAAVQASRDRDAYDDLARMERETECGSCQYVAQQLQNEPPAVAEQGAAELRQMMDVMEELRATGASREEARDEMARLNDQWDVIPDVMAGQV